MKRGCAIALFTWGAASAAYWYFLHARFAAPLDWIVPLAAGFAMALAAGTLRNSLRSGVDAVKLSGASSVGGYIGERPKDDAVVSVTGHIRPTGHPLTAPMSGRPAVLYRYQIDKFAAFTQD